jgi:CheY-like chemotaxis protein
MDSKVTVLYVDDESINRFLFERNFQSAFRVLTATSGEDGLRVLAESGSDVIAVLTDMRMPGMDGVEFVRKAKEKFKDKAYYILTAFNFHDDVDKAIAEGLIDKYFTKPFDVPVIKAEIERIASLRS